ncbi:hypothetical protein HMN09_00350800 [Mycena chlorophos]|uniref:F-box domain-containing protein n=1 Tax=Mycena chlorophos TaxID=658473 RepID=A0A8H6TKM3_MYCCL|nr:hypothetical protein HMN09_00350800 [Mycena chlorophos]
MNRLTLAPQEHGELISLLPQELIEHILSLLDDRQALKICASASSTLRSPCQRLLFSSFALFPPLPSDSQSGETDRARDLLALLSDAPHIPAYVRSLTVYLTNELTVGIIRNFCNFTTLRVVAAPAGRLWDALPEPARAAIADAVQLSSLRTLVLAQLGISGPAFSTLLNEGARRDFGLELLRLENIWTGESEACFVDPANLLKVERVVVDSESMDNDADGIVNTLGQILDPDSVHYVCGAFASAEKAEQLRRLLELVGKGVEHLHLGCAFNRPLDASPDIRSLTNLHTLEFTVRIPSQYLTSVRATEVHYERWVVHLVRLLASPTPSTGTGTGESMRIHRVQINALLQTPYEADLFFLAYLEKLDLLFAKETGPFQYLREVLVRLILPTKQATGEFGTIGASGGFPYANGS